MDGVHDDLKTLNSKASSFPETVTVQVPEYKQMVHLLTFILPATTAKTWDTSTTTTTTTAKTAAAAAVTTLLFDTVYVLFYFC